MLANVPMQEAYAYAEALHAQAATYQGGSHPSRLPGLWHSCLAQAGALRIYQEAQEVLAPLGFVMERNCRQLGSFMVAPLVVKAGALALVAEDPLHEAGAAARTAGRPAGRCMVRRFLLEASGWRVLQIPLRRWEAMDRPLRQAWLRDHVAALLVADASAGANRSLSLGYLTLSSLSPKDEPLSGIATLRSDPSSFAGDSSTGIDRFAVRAYLGDDSAVVTNC